MKKFLMRLFSGLKSGLVMLVVYSIIALIISLLANRVTGNTLFESGVFDGFKLIPNIFSTAFRDQPIEHTIDVNTLKGLYAFGVLYGLLVFIFILNTVVYEKAE